MPAPLRHPLRRLALPALAVALLGGGWALSGPRQATRPALQRAWWYWHHPFRLSSAEVRDLRRADCARLYVHAGTLLARSGRLELKSPQRFESAAPCPLFAVLRVHPGAHALLLSPTGASQVSALLHQAQLPATVQGLQLDADIPTAGLVDYARLLAEVRRQLPAGWELSVTALPDWLGSGGYARVCDAVDEVAPQFYGNRWPVSGRKPPPLWETAGLTRQALQATAGRARAWIGLPAYGRCLVLDPQGRPAGVRHDLDPEQLLETSDWTVSASDTRTADGLTVEDSLTLRAATDAMAGSLPVAPGASLWFQWPRIEALERTERELAALHAPGVAGVCYFRWPASAEPLALRPQPHAAASRAHSLTLAFQKSADGMRLVVSNEGADAPRLPEGVRVSLTGDLRDVEPDAPAEYRCGNSPCSSLRADRVLFSRALLRPGSHWTVCQVAQTGARLAAQLTWRDGEDRVHAINAESTPAGRSR
jgi:hypothetical protein